MRSSVQPLRARLLRHATCQCVLHTRETADPVAETCAVSAPFRSATTWYLRGHAARARPRRPDHQRRHRRAPPPAHPRPGPHLPAHRTPPRTHTPNPARPQPPRTLTWVRGVLDDLRDL